MLYMPYPEMFECRKCKQLKHRSQFQKHKLCSDGIERRCLECKRAHNKAWTDAHPEKVRQYNKKWYSAHPEVINAWRDSHPDTVREMKQRYIDSHREELNEKHRQ